MDPPAASTAVVLTVPIVRLPMHRVALLIFSESRTREDVYKVRKPLQDKETDRFIKALEGDIEFFIPSCKEIRGKADSRVAARECQGADVSAVILYIPIFINPALVAHTATLSGVPFRRQPCSPS